MLNSTNSIVKKLREQRLLEDQAKYDAMDDKELISLAQGGDQLAFNTLVSKHQDLLYKMINKYFLGHGDKDDLYQIAQIAFWDAVQSYESGDFEAYAGMLIKRRLTDEVRKDNTGKEEFYQGATSLDQTVKSSTTGGPGEDRDTTLGDVTPNGELSPEDQFIGNEGFNLIMDFIENDLSDNERNALKYYIDGYKVSEITDMTGLKYKAVENALRRAKEKIAEYLRDMSESILVEGSIFTEKELSVLKSVFDKLGESKALDESETIKSVNGYTIKKDEDKENGFTDYHVFEGGKILATYDDLDLAIKDCESDWITFLDSEDYKEAFNNWYVENRLPGSSKEDLENEFQMSSPCNDAFKRWQRS